MKPRKAFTFSLFCLIAALVSIYMLGGKGCFTPLTKNDMILKGFEYQNKPKIINRLNSNGTIGQELTLQPYASLEEYRSINPDCCRYGPMNGEQAPPTWMSWALGGASHEVTIHYIARWKDPSGNTSTSIEDQYLYITGCGVVTRESL